MIFISLHLSVSNITWKIFQRRAAGESSVLQRLFASGGWNSQVHSNASNSYVVNGIVRETLNDLCVLTELGNVWPLGDR